ncbi:MAG TPA: replication-associated recombination protein A [Candidatus Paceibacterota bacterium]
MEQGTARPLADRMRPEKLEDFVGQEHIIGEGKVLRKAIESDELPSIIFWGPPGSGKTTLAYLIAKKTHSDFIRLSATSSGVKDIREVVKTALERRRHGSRTILFIDEVHRFNKSQQDAFLPHVENGTIILIGATTENPSFEINSALLSRSRVFVLNMLETGDIEIILKRALTDKERGLGKIKVDISEETIKFLAQMANGDARVALNAIGLAVSSATLTKNGVKKIDEESIKESLQKTHLLYDQAGEEHYNIISALHKSMRGGDADAALYWLGRMLEAGEDPLYIARRLIRFASEDIGIANSLALPQAVSAYEACHYIGMPECNVNLAQAVVYMAKSKKSNALYEAYNKVKEDIQNLPAESVPLHLRNSSTNLMKELGYGKNYKYTPKYDNENEAKQDYFPERLKGRKYLKE